MKVKIKRIDKNLPLPKYETAGSVAFDLYSRVDMIISAKEIGRVPTNFIVEVPKGYLLSVTPRSSTPKRKGLLSPHANGIVDQDYHGEKDEILIQFYNFTEEEVKIDKGERIGQATFIRADIADFEEVDMISENSRGGYGSTGF